MNLQWSRTDMEAFVNESIKNAVNTAVRRLRAVDAARATGMNDGPQTPEDHAAIAVLVELMGEDA